MSNLAVVAQQTRCNVLELVHHASLAYVDPSSTIDSLGSPSILVPLRSTAKPFFVGALLGSILSNESPFTAPELSLMSSSHNGEPRHVEVVRGLMKRYGLLASDFRCGIHPRYHPSSALTTLGNNCSGKHALMLIACKVGGWRTEGYLDPEHELHKVLRGQLQRTFQTTELRAGVDGCSLPTYAVPLENIGRAYAQFAADSLGENYARVRAAQLEAPYFMGGTDRYESHLIQRYQLAAKSGAEGVWVIGIPSLRTALAIKVFDGNEPIAQLVLLECLVRLGIVQLGDDPYLSTYYRFTRKSLGGVPCGGVKLCLQQFLKKWEHN